MRDISFYQRLLKNGKKSKIWSFSFSIGKKRYRQSSYTSDIKLAKAYATELYHKAYAKRILNNENPYFSELLTYWTEHNKNFKDTVEKSTYDQHLLTIEYIGKFFTNTPLDQEIKYNAKELDFNQDNTYKLLTFIQNNPKSKKITQLSNRTVCKHIEVINRIYSFCLKRGLIKQDFFKNMNFSKYTKAKNQIKTSFLTLNDYEIIQKLCNLHNTNLLDYIDFAIETGLRKNEQLSLKWQDINLENKYLSVHKAKMNKKRDIALSPKAFNILTKRKHLNLNVPFELSPSTLTGHWDFIRKLWLKEINHIDRNFTWHDLRHTFATWSIKGFFSWQFPKWGMDEIGLQMGHSSKEMTKLYAHLDLTDLISKINQKEYNNDQII